MANWTDENGIPVAGDGYYVAEAIDWQILETLPVIHEGQADDCHIDTGTQRVWLARTTAMDGEHCDHHVTVETYDGHRWVTTSEN